MVSSTGLSYTTLAIAGSEGSGGADVGIPMPLPAAAVDACSTSRILASPGILMRRCVGEAPPFATAVADGGAAADLSAAGGPRDNSLPSDWRDLRAALGLRR